MKNQFVWVLAVVCLFATSCSSEKGESDGGTDSGAKPEFTVSERAAEFFGDSAEKAGKKYIRAMCDLNESSGFDYSLDERDDYDKDNDTLFTFGELKVIIDKESMKRLNGASYDIREVDGVEKLVISNPNDPEGSPRYLD